MAKTDGNISAVPGEPRCRAVSVLSQGTTCPHPTTPGADRPVQPLTPLFLMDLRSSDTTSFPSTLLHLNPFVHVTRMLYGETARRKARRTAPTSHGSQGLPGAGQGLDGHTAQQVSPSPLSACELPYQHWFPCLHADKVYGREIARESLIALASKRKRDSRNWVLWAPGAKPVPKPTESSLPRPCRMGVSPSPVARGTGCVHTVHTAEPPLAPGRRLRGALEEGKGLDGIGNLQP